MKTGGGVKWIPIKHDDIGLLPHSIEPLWSATHNASALFHLAICRMFSPGNPVWSSSSSNKIA